MKRVGFLALCALFISGCVNSNITSYTDPTAHRHPAYTSVIVFGLGMGLQDTETVESGATGALGKLGVQSFRGVDILPPTRTLSREDAAKAIAATGAQSALVITAAGKGVSTSYAPPTYTPGPITGTAFDVGNMTVLNLYQAPGSYSPGYTVEAPNARYGAALIDMKTGNTAWQSEISLKASCAGGTRLAGLVAALASSGSCTQDALARETGGELVQKLNKDGLIKAAPSWLIPTSSERTVAQPSTAASDTQWKVAFTAVGRCIDRDAAPRLRDLSAGGVKPTEEVISMTVEDAERVCRSEVDSAISAQRASGAEMTDDELRQRLVLVMVAMYQAAALDSGDHCFGAFQQSCY
jgi:hypothetical protein